MSTVSVIERIGGASFTSGANHPFLLDDPASVIWVERGHLDIFAVEVVNGSAISRKPFVTRVPAGAMCFGARHLVRVTDRTRGLALLAVPAQGAIITKGERAGIASEDGFDLDTMIRIDEWIFRLSEFVGRHERPPPRGAQLLEAPRRGALLLEADPDVAFPAGATLSANHSDIIWVSANRAMRFMGRDNLAITAQSPPVPLTERTWTALDEDTEVSGVRTPGAFVTGRLWPAFDRFGMLVLRHAAIADAEKLKADRERYRSAYLARRATGAAMARNLGKALGAAKEDGPDAVRATPRTPLQTAVAVVAESMGVEFRIPRNLEEADDTLEGLAAIARASGIRGRRISLAPDWWRRDGPSFVGLAMDGDDEDGEVRPLAVLLDGGGAWRAVDPADGTAFAVGGREAARIARHGMMFYAPLPRRVESGLAALRHALRGRRRDLGTLLAMAVLGALLALLTPILTGQLLAEVIPRVDTPMWIAILGALLLGAFGTAMFDIVRALALLRIEGRVDEHLQAAVWSRLLSLPTGFFRNFTAGDLADRANGIAQIRQLLTGATTSAVIGGVFSIFSYALLFWYSWKLALCAGGVLLVLIGGTWIFARGQMKHHRAAFRAQGAIDGFVFQMITGLAKLRMANAENHALARWAERFTEQKRETFAARRWAAGQLAFNSMFTPLASLAIFAFIWYVLIEGEAQPLFDLSDFLSFNAAFGQFAAAMTGLTAAWTTAVAAIPLFERVQPILRARPETTGGGTDPGELRGSIEFAKVSFRYLPEVPNAVDEVSFRISPGEFVAFVGPSGSGKSTIFRLLLGFEQPDSGTVFLDGHDLSSLDLPAVRSRLGVVLQNGQLVAASIFKNIASSSSLTMDEAWAAARAAGLAEDIEAMPMGMHTVLPEGGGGLSGGQKQRLLIARALARKPRILLFDEATSALDNRTQEVVQTSLKSLSVTRVVIAHRLSTVQNADRIHVMKAGRIVESGRYDSLMERDGVFAALARRQVV